MKFKPNLQNLVDLITLVISYLYLSSYYPWGLIFLDTVVAGGDTASHYSTVDFLKNNLFSKGKLIGWFYGNYGGFPLFIYYFPLLFVSAAWLGYFIPLKVALKLVTIIGPFSLPICSYLMLRLCKFRFPGPALGVVASLLFLVNTSNSMWGGNIYSTLAGEFSYGFSFSLTFVFLGLLYRIFENLNSERLKSPAPYTIFAILVLAGIGLSHGFTLIICLLSSLYFLITRSGFTVKIAHIAMIFGVAGALFSFWFIPLFLNLPYATQYHLIWEFESWKEVLPEILLPTLILFFSYTIFALVSLKYDLKILNKDEVRVMPFIWFIIACCIGAYYLTVLGLLKLPDIRFIPFVQFLTAVWGAAFLGSIFKNKIFKLFLPLIGLKLALLLISANPSDVAHWAKWNYQGYERAPAWSIFEEINGFLKGSYSDPRVVFEHHDINNHFGSTRAFENLPLFSGRSTLEGLYFQSSLLSPFVFYLQSLYSSMYSCPFTEYSCASLSLEKAYDYLKLFNVNQIISLTANAKSELALQTDKYTFQKKILESDYEVWKLNESPGYVEVLKENPEFSEFENFREKFYEWFKTYSKESRFLYTKPDKFSYFYDLNKIPEKAPEPIGDGVNIEDCRVVTILKDENIKFKTNCVGKPHLIKFAYSPGWKVHGGIGPYLVSPAFMLVYPTSENVELLYEIDFIKSIGLIVTVVGLGALLMLFYYRFRNEA